MHWDPGCMLAQVCAVLLSSNLFTCRRVIPFTIRHININETIKMLPDVWFAMTKYNSIRQRKLWQHQHAQLILKDWERTLPSIRSFVEFAVEIVLAPIESRSFSFSESLLLLSRSRSRSFNVSLFFRPPSTAAGAAVFKAESSAGSGYRALMLVNLRFRHCNTGAL